MPLSGTMHNASAFLYDPQTMTGNSRVARFTVCLLALACSGLARAGAPDGVASPRQTTPDQQPAMTVVIGSAAPLSGAQAAFGADNTDGVRMAIDDLNKRDIQIGGHRVVWRLDAQDDKADPSRAVQVARRFVAEHVNGVIGHLNSSCTAAAAPIYASAGIPEITPSASDPKIAQHGYRTFYRIIANDYAIGAGLALYAQKGLKAKTAAIVDDGTAYGSSIAQAFARVAKSSGIQILDQESVNPTATKFEEIVDKIGHLEPDVVFYGGMAQQASTLLQQMRSHGSKARFLGGDGICTPEFAKLAGAAANSNVICAEGGVPTARMPSGSAWKDRFDAQFGASTFQLYAPYAYDATMLLAQAMIQTGSVSPQIYRHAIRHIGYDGVTKSNIQFNSDGELVDPAITISSFPGGHKTALSR